MVTAAAAPAAAGSLLFELRGVSFGVAERTILHSLDLGIESGTITGLIGPNGSGKSTLVKLLARQTAPSVGEIRFGGRSIAEGSVRDFARRLAYLPQFMPFTDGMTVEEFVGLGRFPWHGTFGRFSPKDRAKVADAVEQCGLQVFRDRLVDTMSGGERQRVALAMMLAQDTDCLILDEPTSALDIAHQAEMLRMLGAIARARRLSVVIVLHDINMAARLCDRLVALGDGRIVADADPAGIMRPEVLRRIYGVDMQIFKPPNGAPVGYLP